MPKLRSILVVSALICMIVLCAFAGVRPANAGEFTDLGFEDGTLDSWVVVSSPDAVDVSGGDVYAQPYWGDYMAVLGTPATGVASQPIGQNAITKTFTVLNPGMAFAYNVFTSDYPAFDRFGYVVTLLHEGAVIAQFSTTAFGVSPGGQIVSTGWREVGLDLHLYQMQEITIQIAAGGTSDQKFPTWAYFDMRPVTPSYLGDTMGPVIRLPDLDATESDSSNSRQYNLVTNVYDDSGWATVGIVQNGIAVTEGSGLGWQTHGLDLSEGPNDVLVVASDVSGNTTTRRARVYVDSTPPDVALDGVPARTAASSVMISGVVFDAGSGLASVTVNEVDVPISADGSFSFKASLAPGKNRSSVTAVDTRGNASTWTLDSERIMNAGTGFGVVTGSLQVGSTQGMLDGVSFAMDAAPVIKNSRTLLPIRALIETLGGKVAWDGKTRTATVTLGEHSVVLVVGKNMALVDGKSVPIDAANGKVVPEIIGSRTYLPLRFIAENLGLDLTWEPVSQTISFTYWR
ncbi:MAG: stalk domain-containing protein [Candidatus Cryosericum sp.]